MEINNLIDIIEDKYTKEDLQRLSPLLWKMGRYVISEDDITFLEPLIKLKLIQEDKFKHIAYRLEKLFDAKNINGIKERKEFIFEKLPHGTKLPRGKNTSYDDLIFYVEKNNAELFEQYLQSFKIFDYTDVVGDSRKLLNLYFHRQVVKKSNYNYDAKIDKHVPKDDEVARLLKSRGINTLVEDPEELFTHTIDLSENLNNCLKQYIGKSVVKAIFLCVFLGCFGAHKFYLEQKKSAYIMLGITILSGGRLLPITMIWAFVDLINLIKIYLLCKTNNCQK